MGARSGRWSKDFFLSNSKSWAKPKLSELGGRHGSYSGFPRPFLPRQAGVLTWETTQEEASFTAAPVSSLNGQIVSYPLSSTTSPRWQLPLCEQPGRSIRFEVRLPGDRARLGFSADKSGWTPVFPWKLLTKIPGVHHQAELRPFSALVQLVQRAAWMPSTGTKRTWPNWGCWVFRNND